MGFGEAVGLFFKNYANFQGRARRAEYWWPVLMMLIVYLVVILIGTLGQAMGDAGNILAAIVGLALFVFGVGIILPSISVAVRRLHDKDMSGWWYLLGIIPFGSFVLLYFFVTEGTQGPN